MDSARAIADVLQREYGDATQTVLDLRVAGAIVAELRALGWADPGEVRAIVAAAGGRVEVPESILRDPPELMLAEWRPDFTTVLTTKQ